MMGKTALHQVRCHPERSEQPSDRRQKTAGRLCETPIVNKTAADTPPYKNGRSDSALGRAPDELVHLKLKPHIELIGQDPFHDLPRIDSSENRREQHGVTAGRQIVSLHLFARPFVIFAGSHYEFHFIKEGKMVDIRPKILVSFAAARRL